MDDHDDKDAAKRRCDTEQPCGPSATIGRRDDRCEVHHRDVAAPAAHDHDHHHDHDHGDHDHAHHHHLGHGHGHDHARDLDRKRLLIAVGISAAILVAEIVGGLVSGSIALLSDAEHVFTDMSAQLLSLLALILASRPADKRRTYGYYRLEILAAVVNGVILLGLAGAVIYSSWQRLHTPQVVHAEIVIPIAIGGLIANGFGAFMLHRASTLNVRGAYLHILSDLGALVAVLIGAAVMAWQKGLYIIDPILGMLIALLVIWGAIRLLREAADVLLEAVPTDVDMDRVRADVRGLDGVEDVHDLHIWTITSGLHALSAHIVVHKDTHVGSNDDLLKRVKELLLKNHQISHSTLQIESTEYEHVGHVH